MNAMMTTVMGSVRRLAGFDDLRPRYEVEFLPAALEIVERPASPLGRTIAVTIMAIFVIVVAWAILGKIDITASAPGRLVPQGKTKIIQPADTGIVTAIDVADGDHVTAGTKLIELNPTQAMADHDHYTTDLLQARLDRARLLGLLMAKTGAVPVLVDPPANAGAADRAAADAAMQAQRAEQLAKLASFDQQMQEKDAEAAEAQATIDKLRISLPMLAAESALRQKLRDMQFGNKLASFDADARLADQRNEIPIYERHRDGARSAMAAMAQECQATDAGYRLNLYQDLDKTESRISELTSDLAKTDQMLREQILRAPIDGTVQQLAIHTIGGVVTPAEPLLVIVPDDAGLVMEAMVENRDVGFIHPGQRAGIKIEAFAFTRYGVIEGKVIGLTRDAVDPSPDPGRDGTSADPTQSAHREPGYIARISLSRDWMMTEAGKVPLGPGMIATAEIQTGRRRIIDFLLSPLARGFSDGLHER